MGTLINHEADIALTLLAMSTARLDVVDFLIPVVDVK